MVAHQLDGETTGPFPSGAIRVARRGHVVEVSLHRTDRRWQTRAEYVALPSSEAPPHVERPGPIFDAKQIDELVDDVLDLATSDAGGPYR